MLDGKDGIAFRYLFAFSLVIAVWTYADVTTASAQDTVFWVQSAGGDFLDSVNWSLTPNRYPGAIDPESITDGSLQFNLGQASPYTVTLVRDASVVPIVVSNDRVLFDLNGKILATGGSANSTLDVGVGADTMGELTVTDGTVSSGGTLNVSGGGSVSNSRGSQAAPIREPTI